MYFDEVKISLNRSSWVAITRSANMMGLFANKIGGITNKIGGITNKILGIANKILVLFDRSIRIHRAHARIHKGFYPCNRCHLATLSENQRVTCGNEVTRVTRNGDFSLNIHSTQLLCLPRYCMWVVKPRASRVEGAASKGRRCRLQGTKVRASWGLGIISKGLGDSSYTPKGMSCVTHRRYRSAPITDIGTRDKLYPYQMEALIVMKRGFSR